MTQPTPPLDLDVVQARYDEFCRYPYSDDAVASAHDVPALIAEIRRLQEMLHPSNDNTANPLHAGWQRAREALRREAEGWAAAGDWGRSATLDVAGATLDRLDDRPKPQLDQRIPVWLRTSPGMRQLCEAWYDPTRGGWILDKHPLLPAETEEPEAAS